MDVMNSEELYAAETRIQSCTRNYAKRRYDCN